MKVIDIMQKVANKEIFKFRIDDVNYYVDKSNYICEEDGTKVDWYIDDEWLNRNAEIIEEEKKIPEKLKDILRIDDLIPPVDENMHKIWVQTIKNHNKINEIIDKINED